MISSSSFSSRTNLKMLKPLQRATRPSTPKTNTAHVPQKVTISSARFDERAAAELGDGVRHAAERAQRRRPHDHAG